MSNKIEEDLADVKNMLHEYVNRGRALNFQGVKEEHSIIVKPDKTRIKPLRKIREYEGHFLAVDCSTRTLKRANNWGIYLFRVAYASVMGRNVNWGYEERIRPIIGDTNIRYWSLRDTRLELESMTALNLLYAPDIGRSQGAQRSLGRIDFLLLDGGSFFGEKRGFKVSLYENCEKEGIRLLTISKQSQSLHDEMGRDFMAAIYTLSSHPIWVYHPVEEANTDEHRYGDVSVVKLCEDSPRVFRCDIMEYLASSEVNELLSPLTSISEDPRCLGYPVALWLAHDFSTPSDSQLLYHYDKVEETLMEAGVLDVLRREEVCCNFPDELHGFKRPYESELIDRV